ncbi:DUF721 domain-containing protein [Flavobacteriaceae bacterium F08102]|nr:DUF721 domain-containing protein [Flavobacteriaceae bacterium F08102]
MTDKKHDGFNDIGSLLKKTLKAHHLQKGLDVVQIKKAWVSVMGQGVATYTKSIEFERGVLTVALSSSVLREELSYGVEKMVLILNEHLEQPLIKKIKLS